MYNNKNRPVECLLENYIEKEILDANRPLFFFQSVLFMSPFCVTNGYVTPVDKKYYIKILIGVCLHIAARVYYFVSLHESFVKISMSPLVIFIAMANSVTYCISITVTYFVNVIQSHNTLQVMLKLRQALFTINMEKQEILKDYKIWNFVYVIGVLLFDFVVSICFVGKERDLTFLFSKVTFLVCDIHLVCLSRTVSFGASLLASWNRKMMIYRNQTETATGKTEMQSMFNAYMHIIDALGLCKNIYQFTLLYQLMAFFNHALYNVELEISKWKMNTQYTFEREFIILRQCLIFVWILKSIVLLVSVSAACERFYKNKRAAEMVCAQGTNTNDVLTEDDAETRRIYKNVVRYNRAVFTRLSVYGAFEIDATTPLRLLLAVGTYTVVLLQFALAKEQEDQ